MPTLKQGSSGPDVKDLQQKLKDLGFDPNGVDGNFGAGTDKAVRAFQQANGLEVDGKVGPGTQAALDAAATQRRSVVAPKRSADRLVQALLRARLPHRLRI